MHFKKLFAPHILDREYYYFIDNAVTGLKDKDGIITAKVEGTRMYDVIPKISQGINDRKKLLSQISQTILHHG